MQLWLNLIVILVFVTTIILMFLTAFNLASVI